MAGRIDKRLAELGIVVPPAVPAFNSYLPWKKVGAVVHISGQGPFVDGKIPERYKGRAVADMPLARAQEAARVTALSLVAQLRAACAGDLDRVVGCIQMTGYVNCEPGFTQTPLVVNGGSDLLVEVFGEAGRHARVAIGAHALPENIVVELAASFEVAP